MTASNDVHVEEFADGYLQLEYEGLGGGKLRLTAKANGEVIESGEHSTKIFGAQNLRGAFLNNVEEALAERESVNEEGIRRELNQWFSQMYDLEEERKRQLLPDGIQAIIDGTEKVEIHGGETTTWVVTLAFAGRTDELEFTSKEWAGQSPGASASTLQEKIANKFFEYVQIQKEDWQEIRDRWNEQAEVVNVVEETASDAIADRVLEKLGNSIKPVPDRENMGNGVAAAWFDGENTAVYAEAPADASIVWVQDSFLVDQLEATGKKLEYKSQLVKDLIARGDLYGSRKRVKWAWDTRTKVYPFKPDALGVTDADVAALEDPNHSEVEA